MKTEAVHEEEQWPYIVTLLPRDLEEGARRSGALRRCRNVSDAAALVRLALAYAVTDLSLKDVAAWAAGLGVAQISGPGLFYRLRMAENWLMELLAETLRDQIPACPAGRLRLRAVDATVINGPGAQGTEWRAHVRIDALTGKIASVELTDEHGGEGYGRHAVEPGELLLGDRAYATARGIHAVVHARGHVLARLNPHTLRVCDADRRVLSLRQRQEMVPKKGAMEIHVMIPIPPEKSTKSHKPWPLKTAIDWVSARAVAGRTRNGEVIWVITTLDAAQASDLLTSADCRRSVERAATVCRRR